MPELPEVEAGRKLAAGVAAGRIIKNVRCDDDDIVFDGVTPKKLADAIGGKTVQAVLRHGKQLWFELDRGPHPLFHFGMTGAFRTPGTETLRLATHGNAPLDGSWPPKFTKIHLLFDDGGELVMTNARRFGRIRLRDDPKHEPPVCNLGFDPLCELPEAATFVALARRHRTNLKGLLLNQKFGAGVGNWIADEVLYRARLDPRRRVPDLDDKELRAMRSALKTIILKAVAVDADKDRLPRGWLFHRRWGKRFDTTIDGEAIEHLTLAGRTTAWVPSRQR